MLPRCYVKEEAVALLSLLSLHPLGGWQDVGDTVLGAQDSSNRRNRCVSVPEMSSTPLSAFSLSLLHLQPSFEWAMPCAMQPPSHTCLERRRSPHSHSTDQISAVEDLDLDLGSIQMALDPCTIFMYTGCLPLHRGLRSREQHCGKTYPWGQVQDNTTSLVIMKPSPTSHAEF